MSLLLNFLQVAGNIGHHRIVAGDEQKRSFVPHSHAVLATFMLFRFCPLLMRVFMHAFLTEFSFRILYPIVPFCVSDVLKVSAHGRRGSLAN